jgi:putative hydrolase of the HAD superfamily
LNSTNPDDNAWARFERAELDVGGFAAAFEAEASAAGHTVEAARVLAALRGEVRPAMVEAIRRLRAHGLPLGMVSNNVSPMERGGRMDDILDLFDVIVESSIEGVRKPEPEIYRRALARLSEAVGRSIEAADCAYLDDLGINLKPARALGFSTIKVVDPADALAELSALVGFSLGGAA